MKGYWILFEHWYCPLCGRESVSQTRVFDRPKPATWQERHIEKEVFDWCDL